MIAGRSNADREAHQDMMVRGILIVGSLVGLLIMRVNALFTVVGLQFGWWSAPVFAPVLVWGFGCALRGRLWRPVELDVLRWRQRVKVSGGLLVLLWVMWPLWAGPVAGAWRSAHGGFASLSRTGAPSFPLRAVLGASPVAMALVAFILLALGMVAAPNVKRRDRREWPGPPADPEPLRAMLATPPRPREQPYRADRVRPMLPGPDDHHWS